MSKYCFDYNEARYLAICVYITREGAIRQDLLNAQSHIALNIIFADISLNDIVEK